MTHHSHSHPIHPSRRGPAPTKGQIIDAHLRELNDLVNRVAISMMDPPDVSNKTHIYCGYMDSLVQRLFDLLEELDMPTSDHELFLRGVTKRGRLARYRWKGIYKD